MGLSTSFSPVYLSCEAPQPGEAPGLLLGLTNGLRQAQLVDKEPFVQVGQMFLHLQDNLINNLYRLAHNS